MAQLDPTALRSQAQYAASVGEVLLDLPRPWGGWGLDLAGKWGLGRPHHRPREADQKGPAQRATRRGAKKENEKVRWKQMEAKANKALAFVLASRERRQGRTPAWRPLRAKDVAAAAAATGRRGQRDGAAPRRL
eukprot:EG_transcript_14444